MHSTRLTHILMMALSVTSVTGVAWLDNDQSGAVGQLEAKRDDSPLSIATGEVNPIASQTSEASSSTDAPASSTDQPDSSTTSPTSTADPTTTPSSTDNTTPTSTNTTPTSTNGATTTAGPTTTQNTPSTSTPTSTSTNGGGGGGGGNNDNTSSSTAAPATTVAPTTSTFTTVYTTTDAAGRPVTTSSSSLVVSTPTVAADSQNENTGMSQGTKSTIIGVCVGVGGAIVLAAAGVLFWRLRSKRRSQEENEELVSYGDGFGGPGTAEKTEPSGSTAGRSPFQSTLESYHAPTQTNAASNF
ncbi:hypothetical protein F5Y06DRAFT_265821 [Hypoxylon sp. FL0890]|nr:hypothetical protein F5Y06DRAFT_265821 [Hypoxylon sp. FL0890]